jgi:hypothetical protein
MSVRLRCVGKEQYELETDRWIFFFSYGVPVGAFDKKGKLKFETDSYFTITTSRHIMKWMERMPGEAGSLKQEKLESLIMEGESG